MGSSSVIDRFIAPAAALALLTLAAGCTLDDQSVATSMSIPKPASAESADFSALSGKIIRIEGKIPGAEPPETKILLHVIGKTIVWEDRIGPSLCILHGKINGKSLAVLYTLNQPRTGVKVPCEGARSFEMNSYWVTAPADVRYSSTMSLRGNVLELSGELAEHNSLTEEKGLIGGRDYTVTEDSKQQQHAKIRISGDTCQVLEFAWTLETREVSNDGRTPGLHRWSVRATGCSIVTQPS